MYDEMLKNHKKRNVSDSQSIKKKIEMIIGKDRPKVLAGVGASKKRVMQVYG